MILRKAQKGVTLSGLLVISVLLVAVAVMGIKVIPDVLEYMKVVKAVKAIAQDPANREATVGELRKAFDRRASIDDLRSLQAEDLDISKEGEQIVIAFAYAKKVPLFMNVSLLIDFEGSSDAP